ncbi:hypothetical protein D3C85_377500 [compost metagenome]
MWKQIPVETREFAILASAELMIDADAFEAACKHAIDTWPNSTEANLTASVINHQAWLGHAACCLSHGASEDLTRLGWRTLTEEQQDAANAAAGRAIAYWEEKYAAANPHNVKRSS